MIRHAHGEAVGAGRAAHHDRVGTPGPQDQGQRRDAGVTGQVVDGHRVAAGSCIDRQLFDTGGGTAGAAQGEHDRVLAAAAGGADAQGVGATGEGHQQAVLTYAAVHHGVAGTGQGGLQVVIAGVAVHGRGVAVAQQSVVVAAAAQGHRARPGVLQHVVAVAAREVAAAGAGGGDDVGAGAAGHGGGAGALDADEVVVATGVDGDRDRDGRVDEELVVPATQIADDAGDPGVGVVAAKGRDLDGGAGGSGADLFDPVFLTGVKHRDVAELGPVAGVEHQGAAGPGLGRSLGAAGIAGQVGRHRQLQVAEGEVGGLAERPEQELDPDVDGELDLHPATTGDVGRVHGEAGADPDAEQREAERAHLDLGRHAEGEVVGAVGARDGGHPEVEVTADPEAVRPDLQVAVQADVEAAVGPQAHRATQADEAEQLQGGAGGQVPGVAADVDEQGGVEGDDLENADAAGEAQQEGIRRDPQQGRVRGVELQGAGGVDAEDGGVRFGADVEGHGEAWVGAAHDGRAAVGPEGEAADGESEGELQLEAGGRDRDVDRALTRREVDQVDAALDPHPEADRDAGPVEVLGGAGGVDGHEGRRREAEPDVLAQGPHREVEPGDQTVRIQAEAGVAERDRPDRAEIHGAVDDQLDLGGAHLELHLAADRQGGEQLHLATHQQPEATGGRQRDVLDDEVVVGVALEAVEALDAADGLVFDPEGLNGPRGGERVDLQQELAVEVDARDGVGAHGELDPSDDAGFDAHVGSQVDDSGHRSQEGEGPAERAVHLAVDPRARAGHGDPQVPVQLEHPADGQLRHHGGLDVHLATGRSVDATPTVQPGRRGEDGDLGRQVLQHGLERLRDYQGLVVPGRVEHHRHGAGDTEDLADVRQPDATAAAHGDAAGDAEVPTEDVGSDEQHTGGRAVGDLRGAAAEGQRAGHEDLHRRGRGALDGEVDPTLDRHQFHRGGRCPHGRATHQFEPEGVGTQHVGRGQVSPAAADPGQGDRLGVRRAGQVHLQRPGGLQIEPVRLQRGEVGLQRGDTPELRHLCARVAQVEDEPSGRGSQRSEPVDLQRAQEGQDEHLAVGIDFEDDLGLDVQQRLAQ